MLACTVTDSTAYAALPAFLTHCTTSSADGIPYPSQNTEPGIHSRSSHCLSLPNNPDDIQAMAVQLWLSLIAYDLGNLWRRLALLARVRHLIADRFATAADENRRAIHQACALLLAAAGRGHLTRWLFAGMLRKIAALPSPAG
jgi:hypothetical protein